MGIPIPNRIIEHEDDCPICVPPAGNRWDAGKTPKYVYARFVNLHPCPSFPGTLPNGRIFKLAQDPVELCHWFHRGATWDVDFWTYHLIIKQGQLDLKYSDGKMVFQGFLPTCPFEFNGFDSAHVTCVAHIHAIGGNGIVSWSEAALSYMEALNITPSSRLMSEPFWHEDGDRVLKYCDKRDATNVKIKFTP